MVYEGARVKLRPGSRLAREHPELAGAVGVVGSIVHGPSWKRLSTGTAERARDTTMHVRFRELNIVAMNVPAADVEPLERLDPELDIVL